MGALLSNLSSRLTQMALDMRETRQKLIASNIANVNTPEYQSKDIEFEDYLRRAADNPKGGMSTTHAMHLRGANDLSSVFANVMSPSQAAVKNDLNSVDMEHELMKMSENNVMYDALITVLQKQIENLDYAIREGGK